MDITFERTQRWIWFNLSFTIPYTDYFSNFIRIIQVNGVVPLLPVRKCYLSTGSEIVGKTSVFVWIHNFSTVTMAKCHLVACPGFCLSTSGWFCLYSIKLFYGTLSTASNQSGLQVRGCGAKGVLRSMRAVVFLPYVAVLKGPVNSFGASMYITTAR